MKTLKNLLIACSLLCSLSVLAQEEQHKFASQEFKIKNAQIKEVKNNTPFYLLKASVPAIEDVANVTQNVIQIIDSLIAVGDKVWKIIDGGRPVVNIDGVLPSVSVLPRGLNETGSLYDMYGWSEPITKTFKVSYQNLYDVTVVDFTFSVMMQYQGTDGKGGVYISGLSVVPDSIHVLWGWNLNAKTSLINITNRGTAEAPVASAVMELSYTVSSPLANLNKRIRFYADGNGNIKMLK